MANGEVPCSCCGSYYGCKCRQVQTTWAGVDERRIADSLEKIVELLEELLVQESVKETPLATLDVMEHNARHTEP